MTAEEVVDELIRRREDGKRHALLSVYDVTRIDDIADIALLANWHVLSVSFDVGNTAHILVRYEAP